MDMKRELMRKAIHMAAIWIPLVCCLLPRHYALLVLGTVTLYMVVIDLARMTGIGVHPLMWRFWGMVLRGRELNTLSGATYMMFSALVTLFLFGGTVAAAATAYLILGDSAAALAGRRWGKRGVFGKTYVGTAACFLVCLAAGAAVPGLPYPAVIAGAATAALVELVPIPVDDNLRIPVLTAVVMRLLM